MNEKRNARRRMEKKLVVKDGGTYAHRTATMKRNFSRSLSLSLSLFLSMKYFQQKKNERMPSSSSSISFHF
jgi:hypothetical protein